MAELTTLARPYAKAVFQAALSSNELGSCSTMLKLAAAVENIEAVSKALASPSLTAKQQAKILIDLCGNDIGPKVRSFIIILAENKRLALLPEIVSLFEVMKANQEKTVEVGVLSAFPLANETQQALAEALKTRLQREVKLHAEVDKRLIGGVIVRTGDLVIDGSVRGKLGKLAEAMNS